MCNAEIDSLISEDCLRGRILDVFCDEYLISIALMMYITEQ